MKYYYVDYSVMGWLNGRWMKFVTEEEYKEAYAETQASISLPTQFIGTDNFAGSQ